MYIYNAWFKYATLAVPNHPGTIKALESLFPELGTTQTAFLYWEDAPELDNEPGWQFQLYVNEPISADTFEQIITMILSLPEAEEEALQIEPGHVEMLTLIDVENVIKNKRLQLESRLVESNTLRNNNLELNLLTNLKI